MFSLLVCLVMLLMSVCDEWWLWLILKKFMLVGFFEDMCIGFLVDGGCVFLI